MIKAFLTASHIFTILKQFGELSDEVCMLEVRCDGWDIQFLFTIG